MTTHFAKAALAALLLCAGPADADTWTNQSATRSDRAFHAVTVDGTRLQLGCFRSETNLGFLIIGDTQPIPDTPGVMIWIEMADGRTSRHPLDTDYLGGGENALIGGFPVGTIFRDFFANGVRISVSAPGHGTFFEAGMRGTAAAMADFQATCGL